MVKFILQHFGSWLLRTYETEYHSESIFMVFVHFLDINNRGRKRTRIESTGLQLFDYEDPFKNYEFRRLPRDNTRNFSLD